ncbi:MAG: hypothetical protein K6F33_07650 [Bacteroidales bacterium]|nr:hypothetical protein [Bacteroidales bacterium]
MNFWVTFSIVLVIVALCVIGLGVQTFWGKKKRFPQYEVGENEEMQKRGIYCMNQLQQMIDREIIEGKKHSQQPSLEDCEGCALLNSDCKIRAMKEKKIKEIQEEANQ